jgi:uncharacterized membrane protein
MELTWTHTHLLLNHFPIIGAIFGLVLLIYAFIQDSEEIKRVTYWGFIFLAILTIFVYISGTEAASVVTELPNVSRSFIHAHRQIAEVAFIVLEVLGVVSILGLWYSYKRKMTPQWYMGVAILTSVIATALVSWAGLQGGIIRHTEVRGEIPFLTPQQTEEDEHGHSEESQGYSTTQDESRETRSTTTSEDGHTHSEESQHSY